MSPYELAMLVRRGYDDGGAIVGDNVPYPTVPDGMPTPSGKAMDIPSTPSRGLLDDDGLVNPESHFTDGMRYSDNVEDRRPPPGQRQYHPSYGVYLLDYYDALRRMREEDAARAAQGEMAAHVADYGEPDLPRSQLPAHPPTPKPRPKFDEGGGTDGPDGPDGGGYEGSKQQGLDAYGGGIGFDANNSYNGWAGGEGRNFDLNGNYTGGNEGAWSGRAPEAATSGGGGSQAAASAPDEEGPTTTGSTVGAAAATDETPAQETRAPPADLSREIAGIMGTSRGKPGETQESQDEAAGQQGFAAPRDPGAGPAMRAGAKPGEDRSADDMATGQPGGQQLTGRNSEFSRAEDAFDRAAIAAGANPLEIHKEIQAESRWDTGTSWGGSGGNYLGMAQASDPDVGESAWNKDFSPIGNRPGAYSIDNQAQAIANEAVKFQGLHPGASGIDTYLGHQLGFSGYQGMVDHPDSPLTADMAANVGALGGSPPRTRGEFNDRWAKAYHDDGTPNTAVAYNEIVGSPPSNTAVAASSPAPSTTDPALSYSPPSYRDSMYSVAPGYSTRAQDEEASTAPAAPQDPGSPARSLAPPNQAPGWSIAAETYGGMKVGDVSHGMRKGADGQMQATTAPDNYDPANYRPGYDHPLDVYPGGAPVAAAAPAPSYGSPGFRSGALDQIASAYPSISSDQPGAATAAVGSPLPSGYPGMVDGGFHRGIPDTAPSSPTVTSTAPGAVPAPPPEKPTQRFQPSNFAAAYAAANRDPASLALALANKASGNVSVDEGSKHDAYLEWLLRNGYAQPRST